MKLVASGLRESFTVPNVPRLCLPLGCLLLGLATWPPSSPGQDAAAPAVHLVRVLLPLTGSADTDIKRTVMKLVESLEDGNQRPLVIFEFSSRAGRSAESTEFERALSLARFLTGGELQGLRTIAYLPESVHGHAVLVVLACEQVVMAPAAELGDAGVIETVIDDSLRGAYKDIGGRRRILPVPLVMGMLDRALAVYRVETPDDVLFVHEEQLEQLTAAGEVVRVDTVMAPGKAGLLEGRWLAGDDRLITHLAANRQELAETLRLPPGSIREQQGTRRRGVQIEISGRISGSKMATLRRSLQKEIDSQTVQLVAVVIDSPGGDIEVSVDLANDLLAIDDAEILTVAVIAGQARSDAAIIASACDELVMLEGSVLGGPGEVVPIGDDLENVEFVLRQIGEQKGRDWSLLLALVSQDETIHQYENAATGDKRFWNADQFSEQPPGIRWNRGPLLETADGLTSTVALELNLARHVIRNVDDVGRLYGLEEELQEARTPWVIDAIERLASEPWFVRFLLFIAFMALMTEASAPGLGVPGFVSGLCFLLFFWIQFFNGTAGWLEVALFVGGLVFIGVEIFLLPGVGVFGIGGGLMVLFSIVLASQTFVVPRNEYQIGQTVNSVLSVGIVGMGLIVATIVMSRYLPNTRFFHRLAVQPPTGEERESIEWNEAVVHLDHLVGMAGFTTTPLSPAGKVRLDEKLFDVISDGEMIEADVEVVVAEVTGNRVVVRKKSEEARGPGEEK